MAPSNRQNLRAWWRGLHSSRTTHGAFSMTSADARATNCPALGNAPDRAGQLGTVPLADCDSTTYVHDHALAGWLGDNRRCSSARGSGRKDALRHGSQAGHKKEQKNSCCVTTRHAPASAACPGMPPRRQPVDSRKTRWHVAGHAVVSRVPHAIDVLPAADAVVVAA